MSGIHPGEERHMPEGSAQDLLTQVMATIDRERVRFVNLEFTDVIGMTKCVIIPIEQFTDCLSYGKWFDGSSIEGFARVICNVRTPDGENFDGDPRAALMRSLNVAKSMGYSYSVAPELEFFLLRFE